MKVSELELSSSEQGEQAKKKRQPAAVSERHFGRITVETSREDKILFEKAGISKGELVDYYDRISQVILPHLKDRPVTIKRHPDGIGKTGFYQKNVSDYFPDWIDRVRVKTKDGTNTQVVCNKKATLVYLADQGSITLHHWLSRKGSLKRPDLMVFDLDPGRASFQDVQSAARLMTDFLEELGLRVFVQLTGSSGIHLAVPLRAAEGFDRVRTFATDVAKHLASGHDELITTEQRKKKRRGRVFIDTLRNAYGQTIVAPYSVRAKPGAPVATPITVKELSNSGLRADKYTIKTIFRRLAHQDDPWKGMQRYARSLEKSRELLGERTGDH